MVLIEVSGNSCDHVNKDIQEIKRIFGVNVRKKLLDDLLPTDRDDDDIDIQFNPGASVDISGEEKYLVKVSGAIPAAEHIARAIAVYCNGAFYCSRETKPIRTKCIIQTHEGFVSVSTEKLLSA
jgi:hypothetical protein